LLVRFEEPNCKLIRVRRMMMIKKKKMMMKKSTFLRQLTIFIRKTSALTSRRKLTRR
jgi:hypothetical protein